MKKQEENVNANVGEQILAADYDPSLDRREDEGKRIQPSVKVEEEDVEEVVEEEDEDDVDDMFAVAVSDKPKVKKVKKVTVRPLVMPWVGPLHLIQPLRVEGRPCTNCFKFGLRSRLRGILRSNSG